MANFFPLVRTRRLTFQLRELTMLQALTIAAFPEHKPEAECTAFLRFVLDRIEVKDEGLKDPANWTVQERVLAVCQYLSATHETPDFIVGKNGLFSDYLQGEKDYSDPPTSPIGTVGDDAWHIRHLTGKDIEIIEGLSGEITTENGEAISDDLHFLIGAMAAQLYRKEELQEDETEGLFEERLLEKMRVFLNYPQDDFIRLFVLYQKGCEHLKHLFDIDLKKEGIVVYPKGGERGQDLPPARFRALSCVSEMAKRFSRVHA